MMSTRHRSWRAWVLVVTMIALCAGLLVAVPPSRSASAATAGTTSPGPATSGGAAGSTAGTNLPPGASAPCDPKQDEPDNVRRDRCVNGTELRSRGYNACLITSRDLTPNVYLRNECYGPNSSNSYIEAIAQARLVQRLDTQHGEDEGVSQRIQWETNIGGAYLQRMSGLGASALVAKLKTQPYFATLNATVPSMRVDVLLVGPDADAPATNPVAVLEVKGDWDGGAAAAATQAAAYVAALKLAGWSNTAARDTTGYLDDFRTAYVCPDQSRTYDEFAVKGTINGAVVVTQTGWSRCRNGTPTPVRASTNDKDTSTTDATPVPGPRVNDPFFSRDFLVGLGAAAGSAAVVTGATAAVKYAIQRSAERAVPRGAAEFLAQDAAKQAAARATAESAAFAEARDWLCMGPVNAATRGPADGSLSTTALACLEITNVKALAGLLSDLKLVLDAKDLAELGLTEDEARTMGLITSPALVRADPHLVTLDGLNYDFHGIGEYTLLDHGPSELEVQMRTVPAPGDLSSVGALAVATSGMGIELQADGTVLVEGQAIDLPEGDIVDDGNGILISRTNGVVSLLTAFDDAAQQALITWTPRAGDRGDFSLAVPRTWAGQTTGMLGNFDGNPHNDLVSAQGVDVTNALNFGTTSSVYRQRLYTTFGDSWRVSDDSSLFTYPTGTSTADYTDRSRPTGVVSLADLSEGALAGARTVCAAAGITEGLSLNDCLLDVGSSGDASYATSLAAKSSYGVGVDDASLGDGPLTVTFNGAVPPNFFPAHLHSRGTGANYAGPFTGSDGYSFYLNDLPGHRGLTVTTTVLVPRSSSADPADGSTDDTTDGDQGDGADVAAGVELLVDGASYPATAAGAVQTVRLPDGSPAQLVPVTFTLTHSARQVQATVRAATGSQLTWFGIDAVTVDADRVPYQQFDVTLTKGQTFDPAVSLHGSGAGVLEEPGSSDRYCFTLAAGSSLLIDSSHLPGQGRWRLWSPSGAFTARDGTNGPATTVTGLSGASCLEVRSEDSSFTDLPYGLTLVVAPDPQTFDTTLLAGAVKITDGKVNGAVTAGAGRLETGASRDVYRFTVPQGGATVYELTLAAPSARWSLTGPGTPVGRTMQDLDQWEGPLAPGQYELSVQSVQGSAGAYDLQLTSFAPVVTLGATSVVSSSSPVTATASWARDLTGTGYTAYLVDAAGAVVATATAGTSMTADIDVDDVRAVEQRQYSLQIRDSSTGTAVDTSLAAPLQVKAMSFTPGVRLATSSVVSSDIPVTATASWNRDLTGTRYVAYLIDGDGTVVATAASGTTMTADIPVDDVRSVQDRQYMLQIRDSATDAVLDASQAVPLRVAAMSFAPGLALATSSVVSSGAPVTATASWNRDLTGTPYAAYLIDADGSVVATAGSGSTMTANIDVDDVRSVQQRQYVLQIRDASTDAVLDTSAPAPLQVTAMSFAPKLTLASSSVVSSTKTVKATASWNRDLTGTKYVAFLIDADGTVVATTTDATTMTAAIDVDDVRSVQQRQYVLQVRDYAAGTVLDTSAPAALQVTAMSFAPKLTLASSTVVSSKTTVKATASWNRTLTNTKYVASIVDAGGVVVGTATTGTSSSANIDVDDVRTTQQRQYSLQIRDASTGAVLDTSTAASLQVTPMAFAPQLTLASSSVVSSKTTVKATASWNRTLTNTKYVASIVDAGGAVVNTATTGTTMTANIDVSNVTATQQRRYSLQIRDASTGAVLDTSTPAPLEVKPKG